MFFFLLSFFIQSCNFLDRSEIPGKKIIFKIEDVKYLGYNLNNEYKLFYEEYVRNYHRKPVKDSIAQFLSLTVNRMYRMADAYRHKIDTIQQLQKILDGMKKYQMTRVQGFLWNDFVVPQLNIDESEIKEAYEKLNKVFYFKIIHCKDSSTALEYEKMFHHFKSLEQIKNEIDLPVEEVIYQWPFSNFYNYKNYLYKLEVNQISKPLKILGEWVILYVNKIMPFDLPDYLSVKNKISELLKESKKEYIVLEKENEILEQSGYKIDTLNFKESLEIYQTYNNQSSSGGYEKIFKDVNHLVLFHFKDFNKKMRYITLEEFNDFYFYQPLRTQIFDSSSYSETIKLFVIDDFMWEEGLSLNLLHNEDHIYGFSWFKNKQMEYFYRKTVIEPKVEIDSFQISDYYKNNKQNFEIPVSGIFSYISFTNQEDAINCLDLIEKSNFNTAYEMVNKNLYSRFIIKENEYLIDYKENNNNEVISLPFFKPYIINHNGEYRIIYKRKEEERLKEFTEVKDEIKLKLLQLKIDQFEEKLVNDSLKNNFLFKSKYNLDKLADILWKQNF